MCTIRSIFKGNMIKYLFFKKQALQMQKKLYYKCMRMRMQIILTLFLNT